MKKRRGRLYVDHQARPLSEAHRELQTHFSYRPQSPGVRFERQYRRCPGRSGDKPALCWDSISQHKPAGSAPSQMLLGSCDCRDGLSLPAESYRGRSLGHPRMLLERRGGHAAATSEVLLLTENTPLTSLAQRMKMPAVSVTDWMLAWSTAYRLAPSGLPVLPNEGIWQRVVISSDYRMVRAVKRQINDAPTSPHNSFPNFTSSQVAVLVI